MWNSGQSHSRTPGERQDPPFPPSPVIPCYMPFANFQGLLGENEIIRTWLGFEDQCCSALSAAPCEPADRGDSHGKKGPYRQRFTLPSNPEKRVA